jgi:ribose transport system ATP-binding protein
MDMTQLAESGQRETAQAGSVVSVRRLSKTFAGTRALQNVDIDFRAGEIHAVCGGNGSGKSTLIKILCGVYDGDEGGEIIARGETIDSDKTTPATAHRAGIRVVHQDLAVFPELTVAENLALDARFETGFGGRIKWRQQRAVAAAAIQSFNIPASPDTRLSELSLAARTEVAIARALRDHGDREAGLLILDEPTAALPVHEVAALLTALRRLAARGQSILYVSHRLDEVLDLADRVTVLKDGRLVDTRPAAELDESKLIELMLGRSVDEALRHETTSASGPEILAVSNLAVGALQDVSFTARAGEVVGIAGLMGSGRSSLLRAMFGDLTPRSGSVTFHGKELKFKHPRDAIAADIVMVPENRVRDGVFLDQTVDMNVSIAVIRSFRRKLRLANSAMARDTDGLIATFGIKAPSGGVLMSSLSGGNQQKAVMARWLRRNPSLLLLDEPTQGVDVGARADIYRIVRQATSAGAVAIVVASDFEELAAVSDRVLVLRTGRIVSEVSGADITAQRLSELSYADD